MYLSVFQTSLIKAIVLRRRNDLYCVGWGIKLYSLTHSVNCAAALLCYYKYYYRVPSFLCYISESVFSLILIPVCSYVLTRCISG